MPEIPTTFVFQHVLASVILSTTLALGGACSAEMKLTSDEVSKLDAPLRELVVDGKASADLVSYPDNGALRYAVVMRVTDAEALRTAGLPLGTVTKDVVTARLTVDEIRKAARMAAVRAIGAPGQRYPD